MARSERPRKRSTTSVSVRAQPSSASTARSIGIARRSLSTSTPSQSKITSSNGTGTVGQCSDGGEPASPWRAWQWWRASPLCSCSSQRGCSAARRCSEARLLSGVSMRIGRSARPTEPTRHPERGGKLVQGVPDLFQGGPVEREEVDRGFVEPLEEPGLGLHSARCEHDGLHPAVGRNAAALDQSPLLQPVDHPRHVRRITFPRVSERSHRARDIWLEHGQRAKVARRESELAEDLEEVTPLAHAQIEQGAPSLAGDRSLASPTPAHGDWDHNALSVDLSSISTIQTSRYLT